MCGNIWTLISGRNGSRTGKISSMMYWMTLAVTLLGSTCLGDENARNKRSKILEEAEENIRWLRQAKEQVEREEREKNFLAGLTDVMIKDSFDSQLMSKIDILYDNQTDLSKELKFVPQVFNCGKEFDIFKVLELAKAHRNITTEAPKCIMDSDDSMCSTKKSNGGYYGNVGNKSMKILTQPNEGGAGVSAFLAQMSLTTKMPFSQQQEKKTIVPPMRQPSPFPQSKVIKIKSQNKERPPQVEKELRDKIAQNYLQKQLLPKTINSKPAIAEASLEDVQLGENSQISEDLLQRWYPAQLEQNEMQHYSSIENQINSDDGIKLQEPLLSNPKTPESLQQSINDVKSPMIQSVSQQTNANEQPSPLQVAQQSQVQSEVINEIGQRKLPGLEQRQEANEHGDQLEQGEQRTITQDKINQDSEKKESAASLTQQQSQQVNLLAKQAVIQKSPAQAQMSEQQHINQQQLQNSEKRIQQQLQPLDKQNQQQPQSIEKQNQQQPQILEKQNQQQLQSAEHNQQRIQTPEKVNQQTFQVLEKQNQQQVQTVEPLKQQNFQNNEKPNLQLQNSEKHNQPQFQIMEKQSPATMATMTESERQYSFVSAASGSEQLSAQKTSNSINDQQQILRQQTLFYPRIEQNQLTTNPVAGNYILSTSAQQTPQLPDVQSVAKLPSEAPNKAFTEGSGEKFSNNNPDKTMMSAPINVMVMDSNPNSSNGNATSKLNLVPGSIPATAYFWSYTLAHTPKIQNIDGFKTEEDNAELDSDILESSDTPGNIQDNPKVDYLYYQDQD